MSSVGRSALCAVAGAAINPAATHAARRLAAPAQECSPHPHPMFRPCPPIAVILAFPTMHYLPCFSQLAPPAPLPALISSIQDCTAHSTAAGEEASSSS